MYGRNGEWNPFIEKKKNWPNKHINNIKENEKECSFDYVHLLGWNYRLYFVTQEVVRKSKGRISSILYTIEESL